MSILAGYEVQLPGLRSSPDSSRSRTTPRPSPSSQSSPSQRTEVRGGLSGSFNYTTASSFFDGNTLATSGSFTTQFSKDLIPSRSRYIPPSPRTQRIKNSARSASERTQAYDEWLLSQYGGAKAIKKVAATEAIKSRHRNHFEQERRKHKWSKSSIGNSNAVKPNHPGGSHGPWEISSEARSMTRSAPWSQNSDGVPLDAYFESYRSRDMNPDRFGHETAKRYDADLKASGRTIRPTPLVPNSKSKKEVEELISSRVLSQKNEYNELCMERSRLEKMHSELNNKFLQKLDIRFSGLAFEVLPFEQALGVKSVVDKRLHKEFHKRVFDFVLSITAAELPATSLVDEVDTVMGKSGMPLMPYYEALFHNPMETAETILKDAERLIVANRIFAQAHTARSLDMVHKRKMRELQQRKEHIEDLNHLFGNSKNHLKELKSDLIVAKKEGIRLGKNLQQLRHKLRRQRMLHRTMMEKSRRIIADDEVWQRELEHFNHSIEKVARNAQTVARTANLKKVSMKQAKKSVLLMAEQMYHDKRLAPYKNAADRIFRETGVDSVEKILTTFQDQTKKESLMNELVREKEVERADKITLLARLRKVIQRGTVAGVHVPQNDGNIESVEASLEHAKKLLATSRKKLVLRETLSNECIAGVSSLCAKLGLPQPRGHRMIETLNVLEETLVSMLGKAYKAMERKEENKISSKNEQTRDSKSKDASLFASDENNHITEGGEANCDNQGRTTKIEMRLHKQILSSGKLLSSPCDSPNNIRVKVRRRGSSTKMEGKVDTNILAANSDHVIEYDDAMDVLPNMLTPASLEGYLRDAVGDYTRIDPSEYDKKGRITTPRLAQSFKVVDTAIEPDAASDPKSTTSGKAENNKIEENVHGESAEVYSADLEVQQLRLVQKWGSATVVETYKKQLRKLERDAKIAMKEGRSEEAKSLRSVQLEKLKTRGKQHSLHLLTEHLSGKKSLHDATGRKRVLKEDDAQQKPL